MWKIYVGNLDGRIRERELADEFRSYGNVRSVWVARNPPGYAFVELDDRRDAEDAIAALDGKHGWRVEMSKKSLGYSETKCYECGSSRHFSRDCHYRSSRHSHRRSPSPYSRRDGHRDSSGKGDGDDSSPRYCRRSSSRGSPHGGGRNYEKPSGSERSESRGSNKRRRERSISLEDTKFHVKSPKERERNRSPDTERENFERGTDQSKSPQSIRSDLEASPVMRERSRSPSIHQRSSVDGSPVSNGRAHSKSLSGKTVFDLENDRNPESNGDADPKDMEPESN